MDTTNAPQIIDHHSSSLDFTPYDTKWVPGTAQFVLGGQTMKATGILKMYRLTPEKLADELTVVSLHPRSMKARESRASPSGPRR
jgi:hypothetical protein